MGSNFSSVAMMPWAGTTLCSSAALPYYTFDGAAGTQ